MTNKEIGKALKNFRINVLKMGPRRFAEFIGIKPSQLLKIEQNRTVGQAETNPTEELVAEAMTIYRHSKFLADALNLIPELCDRINEIEDELLECKLGKILNGQENKLQKEV